MANTIMQVIRTSVGGRIPTTGNIPNAGTLALNMPDKLLFTTNGTTVFPINNSWPDIPHAFYGGMHKDTLFLNTPKRKLWSKRCPIDMDLCIFGTIEDTEDFI